MEVELNGPVTKLKETGAQSLQVCTTEISITEQWWSSPLPRRAIASLYGRLNFGFFRVSHTYGGPGSEVEYFFTVWRNS